MKISKLVVGLLITSVSAAAMAETAWELPLQVSDDNTKVNFDVDTTWHVVYGKTSKLSGTVSLGDPNNLMSIQSDIHFPVKSFDTGWSARDESLHEHMKADKFPEVVLKTTELTGECTPEIVAKGECTATLQANLTICDVSKNIPLDVKIVDNGEKYTVSGTYAFKWADYNVDDPSILVAKVDPTVRVQYSIEVPKVTK